MYNFFSVWWKFRFTEILRGPKIYHVIRKKKKILCLQHREAKLQLCYVVKILAWAGDFIFPFFLKIMLKLGWYFLNIFRNIYLFIFFNFLFN